MNAEADADPEGVHAEADATKPELFERTTAYTLGQTQQALTALLGGIPREFLPKLGIAEPFSEADIFGGRGYLLKTLLQQAHPEKADPTINGPAFANIGPDAEAGRYHTVFGDVGLNFWSLLEDKTSFSPLVFANVKQELLKQSAFDDVEKTAPRKLRFLAFLLRTAVAKLSFATGALHIGDEPSLARLEKVGAPLVLQPGAANREFYSNVGAMQPGDGYFFKTYDVTGAGAPTFHAAAPATELTGKRRSVEFRILFLETTKFDPVWSSFSSAERGDFQPAGQFRAGTAGGR